MGQYWHIALKKGNNTAKIDPQYYGEGSKFVEFAFSPDTLKVLYKLLKEDWYDCQLAIVGDYSTSLEGIETHKYDAISLLESGITEIDHIHTDQLKMYDPLKFERMGFTCLQQSIKIHKHKFYVVNKTKKTYIVIERKDFDTESCVAALLWILVDESSMGHGGGDIQPDKHSDHFNKNAGRWAYDSICILDDDDCLDSLKEYELYSDFGSVMYELQYLSNF